MKSYYINNKSSKLIVFFSGWGCDENQFQPMKDILHDVLILFDYDNLIIPFDFSKYSEIDVIAYSAGVFMSSLLARSFSRINQQIAINGNPFLFDESLGLSNAVVRVLESVNAENYLDFRRRYMVLTQKEFEDYNYYQSQRSVDSCENELSFLKRLYKTHKHLIRNDFNKALFSQNEPFFNLENQKAFYGDKIKIVPEARHHLFFKFKSFEEILSY